MHADTLAKAKYHLKTQHGIAEEFYSNDTTPVYGNGQGAGDSPSQWSQESALLFKLYQEKMPGAIMHDRKGDCRVNIPLAAFADYTNLIGNRTSTDNQQYSLIQEAKDAFTTWNGYPHATGHFMELPKCSCYLQFWKFQEDGYALTKEPAAHGQEIIVKDLDGNLQIIPQLCSNAEALGRHEKPYGGSAG
jgi:hypothetical protein